MAQLKDFLWKEKRIISVESPDERFYTECSFSFIKQNTTRIVRKENISKLCTILKTSFKDIFNSWKRHQIKHVATNLKNSDEKKIAIFNAHRG